MKYIKYLFLLMFCLILVGCTETYNLTIDYDNGLDKKIIEVTEGEKVSLETPEKVGHTFIGWYENEKLVEGNEYVVKDSDAILIAKYEINKYTYKFLDEDGTVLKEETVEYGTNIVAPNDPVKENTAELTFVFTGWDKEFSTITEDITITATYSNSKNMYTYKFLDEDGTVLKEETVEYGTNIVAPNNPSKDSDENYEYTFTGWDKEFSTITENITITAIYEKTPIVKEFQSLDDKVISFLGDSITTFYKEGSLVNSYYTSDGTYYYPKYCSEIDTVDKTWWYQLINNTNMKLGINNSWSGSCAYGSDSSAGCHDGRINTLDENGTPDIVVVYLGTNDAVNGYTKEQLISAFETIVSKIKKEYNPQIYFCTLGYSAYSGYNYTNELRVSYNEAIRKYAADNDFGIIPLDEYVVEDNYSIYLKDSLHYNYKGTTLLSLVAEKAICEYNNIDFNKEIKVEHKEQLPEGTLATITATANSDFWGKYQSSIFFFQTSSATNPQFSHRIELTEKDGKYYVTNVIEDGVIASYTGSNYVIVISDDYSGFTDVMTDLKNVKVGCIAEFDASITLPLTITFKTGDGAGPTQGETPKPEEVKEMLNADGSLHVGMFNSGLWTDYETKAIIFDAEQIEFEKANGSTFLNFSVIKVDLISENEYKVSELKKAGTAVTFTENDYYIFIFMGTKGEQFYNSLKVGDTVIITGDIAGGDCDVKLK